MQKYYFSTALYEFEHGRKPTGRGCWAFSVKGRKNSLFWTNYDKAQPLAEMKKKAQEIARGLGIHYGATLIIEP